MNTIEQFQLLINILKDPQATITEKDDAVIYLYQHNNDRVVSALVELGQKMEEDEIVLNSCGESLGEIWVKRNKFYPDLYSFLLSTVRYGIFYVIKHDKPEWIEQYQLDQDNFKD